MENSPYKVGVDYDFTKGREMDDTNEPRKELAVGVPEFLRMLQDARVTHLKKNADYSGNNDPYENFHRAAIIMEWFDRPIDKVFACLIGLKLARSANLKNKSFNHGLIPNNESTQDTDMDMMVYVGMWGAYDQHQQNKKAEGQQLSPGPINIFKSPYETTDEYNTRISASKMP